MFLRGAGSVLAMPLLQSLLPRSAAAQMATAPRVRYVHFLNPFGTSSGLFYAGMQGNQRVSPHLNVRPLSSVTGPMSPLLSTGYDSVRSKMNVLRGLDVLVANANHQYCFSTCASGYAAGVDNDEAPPLSGQESIDVILSKSSKVYAPTDAAARRLLTLNPFTSDDYSNNRSFSWQSSGTSLQMVRPVKQTQALYDRFSTGFNATPVQPRDDEKLLLQSVYADYKAVRDGPRISADDKQRLEAYMSLVNDIERGLTAPPPPPTCMNPSRDAEVNAESVVTNQLRILAAAMACDLTRVATVTLGMAAGYGSRHSEHHDLLKVADPSGYGLVVDQKAIGARISTFLRLLDGLQENGKTLLDNSAVVWTMQYGCVVVDGQHNAEDMTVMVAGGAGGRLRTGNFIDYRMEGGGRNVPFNNFLVTMMNCMGLSSGDYEQTAGEGYGYYRADLMTDRPNGTMWSTTAGKRTPLPYLYQGPAMG